MSMVPPGQARASLPIVDATIVATMHKLNLVDRLYPTLIAEIAEKVAALRVAIEAVDRAAIRQLTHRLRGGASQLGAVALARALHVIEEAACEGDDEALEAAIVGLDDLVDATVTALRRELERAPGRPPT